MFSGQRLSMLHSSPVFGVSSIVSLLDTGYTRAWCQYNTPRESHVMPKVGKILEAVEDTFGSKQG